MNLDKSDPSFVCSLPSGKLFLSNMQFLSGYCILVAIPEVASINDLAPEIRLIFLQDMARVGDALLQTTGAYRINYAILGNSEPFLHAHIVPRYLSEPEEYRHELPWSYLPLMSDEKRFDPKRDKALIQALAKLLV